MSNNLFQKNHIKKGIKRNFYQKSAFNSKTYSINNSQINQIEDKNILLENSKQKKEVKNLKKRISSKKNYPTIIIKKNNDFNSDYNQNQEIIFDRNFEDKKMLHCEVQKKIQKKDENCDNIFRNDMKHSKNKNKIIINNNYTGKNKAYQIKNINEINKKNKDIKETKNKKLDNHIPKNNNLIKQDNNLYTNNIIHQHENSNKDEIKRDDKNRNNNNEIRIFSDKLFTKPPLVILINIGRTTYITCCLQCLANIRNTTSFYLKHLDLIKKNKQSISMTYNYSRILYHLFVNPYSINLKTYTLENFYSNLLKINPIFKGKSTKNAIDFFVFFIDKLNEESKLITSNNTKIKIKNQIKEQYNQNFEIYLKYLKNREEENTIFFKTFSWINKKIERCWECHKDILSFQYFFTYDLDYENALNKAIISYKKEISIYDCIKYASDKKTLYNVFCKNCNKKNNIDITSTIYLSQNLLIFLLRGIENRKNINDMYNNNIKMKINEEINLSDLVENKNSYLKYTLHALILYDCAKMEYLAYCVSPIDKNWYKYLKDSIIPEDINKYKFDYNLLPVILFYRHL